MAFIKYVESVKDELYDIEFSPGQVIYTIDTNETFFDTADNSRIVLDDVVYLNKESEKNLLFKPLLNKVYIVKESKIIYRYEGTWYKIKDINSLLCTLFHNNQLRPITVMKNKKAIAPRTLASVVYNDITGRTLDAQIDDTNKLTLCKTKSVYVEALTDKQKVFKIPYPISDYDFRKNFMTVIINGYVVEENRFTIRDDDYFVLNDDQIGLDIGQLVLFIFYYNVYMDINDGVLLGTKNLRDRSVTEPKLADNAVSTRTVQPKSMTDTKMADASVLSRTIADSAVELKHVNKSKFQLPAINVEENDSKMFVTKIQKDAIDSYIGSPKLHVQNTAPTVFKDKDIWVDTGNFIFKVRNNNEWRAMGAVYN